MCQMAQTDLALGGGGLRWAPTAAVVTIVLAVGGGLAWFGWNSTKPGAPRVASPAASAIVTGDVAVEGGATQLSGSDIQPIRSAPMLVTGFTTPGRRVARRFTADRRGHFTLKLPPGRYTVTAVLYQGSIPLGQEPHTTVHVRAGQQPHIQILQHAA